MLKIFDFYVTIATTRVSIATTRVTIATTRVTIATTRVIFFGKTYSNILHFLCIFLEFFGKNCNFLYFVVFCWLPP